MATRPRALLQPVSLLHQTLGRTFLQLTLIVHVDARLCRPLYNA